MKRIPSTGTGDQTRLQQAKITSSGLGICCSARSSALLVWPRDGGSRCLQKSCHNAVTRSGLSAIEVLLRSALDSFLNQPTRLSRKDLQ
jgi:hypothetical protein